MNARDPYLHQNLTPDQISMIEQAMRNTVIDGIPLDPRDTVSNPEKFNAYPLELRKRLFSKLPQLAPERAQFVDMGTGQDVPMIQTAAYRGTTADQEQPIMQNVSAGGDSISNLIMNAGVGQQAAPTQPAAQPTDAVSHLIMTAGSQEQPARKPKSFQDFLQAAKPELGLAKDIAGQFIYQPAVEVAGRVKGLVEGVATPGAYAAGQAPKIAERSAAEFIKKYGYEPTSVGGKAIAEGLGTVAEAAKIPPAVTPELAALAPAMRGVGTQLATRGQGGVPIPSAAEVPKPGRVEPTIGKPRVTYEEFQQQLQQRKTQPGVGPQAVGAAGVDLETQRIQRAQELPIPITLEKSQVTRDPADVRYARETAKNPTFGGPFQEKYAEQNALLQKNLDLFVEQTNSERIGVPPTDFGKALDELVRTNKQTRKNEIDQAYRLAREAGETAELVPIQDLSKWVRGNFSAAENAPVIKTVDKEIKRLSKDGQISLNDIEEIRKTINNVRDVSPTNARFGTSAINVIDQITENRGGELYQKARALNTAFAREFQNTPVVAKITQFKKGTTQRQVALENLIESTMIRGTGEDVRQLFDSLQRMGPEGQAMINDLRGYVAQYIRDQATKNTQLDIYGRRYISTPELDKVITNLDKSGKLEFLFGKKGAEQYRTINDVVKDIQTVPRETTNVSGTAAQLGTMAAEMGAQYALTGLPVPLIMVGKELSKRRKEQKEMKKIRQFLDYGKKKD